MNYASSREVALRILDGEKVSIFRLVLAIIDLDRFFKARCAEQLAGEPRIGDLVAWLTEGVDTGFSRWDSGMRAKDPLRKTRVAVVMRREDIEALEKEHKSYESR